MKNVKNQLTAMLLCGMVVVFFSACGDNKPVEKQAETPKVDSVPKPKWNDPGKGKIWSKVNYVQIPLTANEEHIFGPVKSVTYKDYTISEKDGSKTLDDSGCNVYDKAGHLIDQNEFDKAGQPKWSCIYKYDEQNRATEWDIKVFRSKNFSKITFKYDDKGRKVEQNEVAAKKEDSRRLVFKYDDKGNQVEEAEYSGDKKVPWTTIYKYDSRGYQVEYVHRDETGRVLMKMTQEYDNAGNKTSGISYSSDTVIRGKWTAVNDNKGRTIENTYFKKDGTTQAKAKLKYDDWDNITEYVSCKPDGSVDTAGTSYYTDYEYDSKGNIVKETSYKMIGGKKIATGVSERKYEYY